MSFPLIFLRLLQTFRDAFPFHFFSQTKNPTLCNYSLYSRCSLTIFIAFFLPESFLLIYPFWDGVMEKAYFIENVSTVKIYNILMICCFIAFCNTLHSWFVTDHYWAQSQYFHFIVLISNSALKNSNYVFYNCVYCLRVNCLNYTYNTVT